MTMLDIMPVGSLSGPERPSRWKRGAEHGAGPPGTRNRAPRFFV